MQGPVEEAAWAPVAGDSSGDCRLESCDCHGVVEARVVHFRRNRIRGHEFCGKLIEVGNTTGWQPRLFAAEGDNSS